MRIRNGGAWRAAALAMPALAVVLAGAIAPAAASTHAPASAVTWHRLFGINGWHSGQKKYGTGDPRWAVSNGVVYLSGSVIRSSGTSGLLGVLPAEARPGHTLWITVYTLNDTTGTLEITTSGKMFASSSPPGNAAAYTSLAAISYPAKLTPLKPISLHNGWHSEQSDFRTGDPSYTVRNGVAYLAGSLATSGNRALFAVLPPPARPASVEYITVYTLSGTFGTLQINPNGVARAYAGAATQFTSLADVSYPVASASHKLTLINGWQSEQSVYNSGDPAYRISGGVVYLSGSLATAGSNEEFAVLPPGARPAHNLYIKAYTFGSTVGTVLIEPSGAMFAYSPTPTDATGFTSLASISYPLKS